MPARGKRRGEEELKTLYKAHTKRGAITVTDEWSGTKAALKRLCRSAQHVTVNHTDAWRSKEGWHTNDAESENNRIKNWARARYAKLPVVNDGMLNEYMFNVNVGRDFGKIIEAVTAQSDGDGLPSRCNSR